MGAGGLNWWRRTGSMWEASRVTSKLENTFQVCDSDLWPPLANKSLSLSPGTKINPRAESVPHRYIQFGGLFKFNRS